MDDAEDRLRSLKSELEELLAAKRTDYARILATATEISRLEPGVLRFSTDAAMVRRLGKELVAKQETALAELVKNAYDADATLCTVTLDDGPVGGSMEIVDDGCGMTGSDVERGFMRLASDDKVKNPVSPKFGRSRAGKKGIGRFATERLGRKLTIVTQTADGDQARKVTVDWDSFEQGLDIGQIANSIVASPRERPKGTRLLIRRLNDEWTDVELKRVYRYLSTLLQPFHETANREGHEPDPGFELRFVRSGKDVDPDKSVANADSEIFAYAVAVITARIDREGRATWSMTSTKVQGVEVRDELTGTDRNSPVALGHARDVELKAYYFIQSKDLLGQSTGFIKSQLNQHGGIRLYRNGYRVPPYGERDDDWLGLDYKNTKTYAPLSSKVFLGFVALSDPGGTRFEETSSREGLIETAAFQEVRDVMSGVLEAAVRRIESVRGKGRKPRAKPGSKSAENAVAATTAAIAEVEAAVGGLAGPEADPSNLSDMQDAFTRLLEIAQETDDIARERDDLLEELNLLRILASMGLTIAEFTHDFSHLGETLGLNIIAIRQAVGDSRRLESELSRLERQFDQVRAYTAHFSSMLAHNASRDLQTIDLYEFARRFREDLGTMFERRGLTLVVERPRDYDIFTVRMHPSEWSSILLNLLTNAIKAASRSGRSGDFLIRVGATANNAVFLEFCDSGDGIPTEHREFVFDAFFTTTGGSAARAPEAVQALGTGLGLKIVADIVHSVGGTASVAVPPKGYATCIRVEVPAGTPDDGDESTA